MTDIKDNNEPIIKLTGYKIDDLHYTTLKAQTEHVSDGFKIKPSVGMTEDLLHGQVTLDVSLKQKLTQHNSKLVTVTITALFDVSKSLTDRDTIGRALIINGTAIVFPYIRSIVSMITGLDSEQTILLPTIATSKLFSGDAIDL